MVGPVHRDIYVYLLKRITRCFKRAFPDVIEFRKRCYFEKRSQINAPVARQNVGRKAFSAYCTRRALTALLTNLLISSIFTRLLLLLLLLLLLPLLPLLLLLLLLLLAKQLLAKKTSGPIDSEIFGIYKSAQKLILPQHSPIILSIKQLYTFPPLYLYLSLVLFPPLSSLFLPSSFSIIFFFLSPIFGDFVTFHCLIFNIFTHRHTHTCLCVYARVCWFFKNRSSGELWPELAEMLA